MEGSSLRLRLQKECAPAHGRLDDTVSVFDLATASGLAGFLRLNRAAYAALLPVAGDFADTLSEKVLALDQDLAALGDEEPALALPAANQFGLGTRYVLLGSSLGTVWLKKLWSASSDPRVTAASRFLSDTGFARQWADFKRLLETLPATGAAADAATAEALSCFKLFQTAAERARNRTRNVERTITERA